MNSCAEPDPVTINSNEKEKETMVIVVPSRCYSLRHNRQYRYRLLDDKRTLMLANLLFFVLLVLLFVRNNHFSHKIKGVCPQFSFACKTCLQDGRKKEKEKGI